MTICLRYWNIWVSSRSLNQRNAAASESMPNLNSARLSVGAGSVLVTCFNLRILANAFLWIQIGHWYSRVVLHGILRCVPFFCRASRPIKWLSEATHLCKSSCSTPLQPHSLKMWGCFYLVDVYQNLILESLIHWLEHKNTKGTSLGGLVTIWPVAYQWL